MRNDARPLGEDSPASPVGGDAHPVGENRSAGDRRNHNNESGNDQRESVAHDRQSHLVHPAAENDHPESERFRSKPDE
jgi:hypothetical protein